MPANTFLETNVDFGVALGALLVPRFLGSFLLDLGFRRLFLSKFQLQRKFRLLDGTLRVDASR